MLEANEDIRVGGIVATGFVVELPSNDSRIVFVMGNDVTNQPLGIEPVCGRICVHVLPQAVGARNGLARQTCRGDALGENLRMLVRHPCGNGIRGRAEDDLDSGLAHRVHNAVHPCILKSAVLGLPQAPGGFAHANDVQAGSLHQGNVFVEPRSLAAGHVPPRHVLVVVAACAVEHGGEARRMRTTRAFRMP
jgi:hypothetical protein